MMLASSLIELILVDHDLKNWQAIIPKDDQSLKRELFTRILELLGSGSQAKLTGSPLRSGYAWIPHSVCKNATKSCFC